jgi:thiosulfate/3-mercaptopyruvate sulfurtransferase
VEPLAPHERIFVDSDITEDENHGDIPCNKCHGGDPNDPNWKTAHKGVVKDPTYPDPERACGECHEEITRHYKKSLHVTLKPFRLITFKRSGKAGGTLRKINTAYKNHCAGCHSSCGQCHISRPNSVHGGLLEGHLFQKKPPMKLVCTACHGSRIGKEFFGENRGMKPDIHHQKYMKCHKCHTGAEMHGDGKDYPHRYAVENGPKCVNCHKKIYEKGADNAKIHNTHRDKASCYVCHSQPYKNCSSCHVSLGKNRKPKFKTDPSWMTFKIGLNPLKSTKRPEKFVTLRHITVSPTTYKYYGVKKLKNFDALPTWKMATPHNIRRKTEQNSSCNSCHGNSSLFLLEKDVKKSEVKANRKVIVPVKKVPGKVE